MARISPENSGIDREYTGHLLWNESLRKTAPSHFEVLKIDLIYDQGHLKLVNKYSGNLSALIQLGKSDFR